MNICIQDEISMARQKLPNFAVMTLRLNEAEQERFKRIFERAKYANPYISQSNVIRELIGLEPLDILTSAEVVYFKTGKKNGMVFKKADELGEMLDKSTTRKRKTG